jgi:hypothetical protein
MRDETPGRGLRNATPLGLMVMIAAAACADNHREQAGGGRSGAARCRR